MNRGINTLEYWNMKHTIERSTEPDDFISQIDNSSNSYHKVAADIIKKNYHNIRHKSILEIGCGSGYFCSYIKQIIPDWKIEGWDFSEIGIASSKEKNQGKEGIDFKVVDILETPVKDDYGFICCFETIEHIEENVNYQLLDNWAERCEYLLLSTVTTPDDCRGEHISHYEFDTFEKKGYDVIWKTKLTRIDLTNIGYNGDYYYVIFLIKGDKNGRN